jgi:hypothetical protein
MDLCDASPVRQRSIFCTFTPLTVTMYQTSEFPPSNPLYLTQVCPVTTHTHLSCHIVTQPALLSFTQYMLYNVLFVLRHYKT